MEKLSDELFDLLKSAVPLLLEWYGVSKRALPWRGAEDPYRILVSEIMLQQTRVEMVKGYYPAFLEKFPTAAALAAASEEDVLKAWEGLGYYSRARNLKKAAEIIAKSGFPRDFKGIRALPGVGDYTAGAILSIAFRKPCPAVDGNVLRILTRLLKSEENIDEPKTRKLFAEALRAVYPEEAGDFCQALMELGAIVCVPNGEPLCPRCPWEKICRAHLDGQEASFPVRSEKKERKIEKLFVLVLEREGKYALEKRAEGGLLAGLWQFPCFGEEPPDFGKVACTKRAKHVFTHIEWQMTGRLVRAREFFPQFVWADREEIREKYAVPSAFKAFFEWIGQD